MRRIVQVEYRSGLLNIREEILQFLGCPVLSVLGSQAARQLDLCADDIGVILIGHGTAWEKRCALIDYFKAILPTTPVVAPLRVADKPFPNADYNCAADNAPEWVRAVTLALAGIE